MTSAAAEAEKRGVVRKGKSAAKRQRKIREPKLKTGAAEDREVEFSLTEEEVWERCRKRHLPQLSAGQVLALR